MNAGKLRHRVDIQSSGDTQDSVGQPIPAWATIATVWAKVEPLNGREYFIAQQVIGEVNTTITLRYRAGITEKMRIVSNGIHYNIKDVIDVNMRHIELVLMCASGVIADNG